MPATAVGWVSFDHQEIVFMGKRTASATTLKPDPRYHSELASKFINCMMWQGKKATAQRIFYNALAQIKKRMPTANPTDVFTQGVTKSNPPVRVGPSASAAPRIRSRCRSARPGNGAWRSA